MSIFGIFIVSVFSFFVGCSGSSDSNTNNNQSYPCIGDCCYEQFSCDEFKLDNGKNPMPYSVKCSKDHGYTDLIDNKYCYQTGSKDSLNYCCQKP